MEIKTRIYIVLLVIIISFLESDRGSDVHITSSRYSHFVFITTVNVKYIT